MSKKLYFYSNLLMMLTSIHHVYGAYIYHTPWRLHVLALSVPVLAFNWIAEKKKGNRIIYYTFLLTNLIVTTCLIGVYEGVYNHLMKDILFYAGANSELMTGLFPPPKYTMPNDFFFEMTGVLQGLIACLLIYRFIKEFSGLRKYSASREVL